MKKNQLYLSPECEEIELRIEGMIAASGDPKFVKPFNDEEDC